MIHNEIKKLCKQGLWENNIVLVQILGLCPLLAVSNTTINAIGLGIATIFVLIISNTLVALTRQWLLPEIRIPIFVLLIASAVTIVQLLIQAFAYSLYQSLGIYLSLIVTNCGIIARAESYAIKNPIKYAVLDGIFMGIGFALPLIFLGIVREVMAKGTILAQADILFGTIAKNWTIRLFPSDYAIILAALPPGAFLCYGLMIAAKNSIDQYIIHRKLPNNMKEP